MARAHAPFKLEGIRKMNKTIKGLASVIRTFRTANVMLRGVGSDSHILVEHIEAFLYMAGKQEALMSDAQKDLGYKQLKTNRVFKHLRRLGWVSIAMDTKDERQRRITLTKEGNDFFDYLEYKLTIGNKKDV
tara:strand:- start:33 stop:428 length:396 start_codon:yes stop_codon:yes gene_type:complete